MVKAKALHRMTLRELKGRKVRLLSDMETRGGTIFQAGAVLEVYHKHGGLSLQVPEVCPHCKCGIRHQIAKVSPFDVELINEVRR